MLKKIYIIFCFLCLIFIILNLNSFNINPINKKAPFILPYKTIGDSNQNIYVIDDSKRRVLKIDEDKNLNFIIKGGSREEKKFYYAEDIATDNMGNIYLVNRVPDTGGFYTISEEIIKFSKTGKFKSCIYKKEYTEKDIHLIQRGKIINLYYIENKVKWFILEDESIIEMTYDIIKNKLEDEIIIPFQYASILVYNILDYSEKERLIITKKGEILLYNIDNKEITNYFQGEVLKSPYDLSKDIKNNIYLSDILNKKIYQIKDGTIKEILSSKDTQIDGIFYEIYINPDNTSILYTQVNEFIVKLNLDTNKIEMFGDFNFKTSQLILASIFWLFSVFLIINVIVFIINLLNKLIKKNSKLFYNILIIVIVISLSTFFIAKLMLQNFDKRYISATEQKCSLMVQLISKNVNGDLLEKINDNKDFLNPEYMEFRKSLIEALNYNQDKWNENYYFAIYKVIDEKLYAYMYLNDEIGLNYPMEEWYEIEGSAPSRAIKGEIVFEIDEDQWGSWFYSMGPIRNSKGDIVGLIEIGSDFYSYKLENKKLISRILLDIATLLIVLILIFFEFLFFSDINEKKEKKAIEFSDTFYVRPFNFIFTFAISMSISFIPLMMKEIYNNFIIAGGNFLFKLGEELVIALPLSFEMFLFSIAILIGGIFVERNGFRKLLFVGIIFSIAGLVFSSFLKNPYLFIVARSIVGFGSGFVLISLRSCINCEQDLQKRSESFSHYYSGSLAGVNAGIVIGAFIADQYGYKITFYVAIILVIASLFIAIKNLIKNNNIKIIISNKSIFSGIFKLIGNWKVLAYLFFAIMPTYIAGMFLVYYVPLFSQKINLNISDIGRLFILNGMLIIYVGPILSQFLKKHITNKTGIFITSILWSLTLIYFAINQNLVGLIITIVVMGITEGFGVVFQNDYFLDLPIVKKIGEDLSVTYFELFAKFAEVIAPVIFGWILLFKYINGMLVMGLIIILISIIYFLPYLAKIIKRGVRVNGK